MIAGTLPALMAAAPARPAAAPTRAPALGGRQSSFAAVISRARTGADGALSPEDKARAAAEQLVAITFVQPLLKMARQSRGGSAPFAPTEAERRMGTLMDAQLAGQLVHAARFPIVDRVARGLLEKHAGALPAEAAAPKPDASVLRANLLSPPAFAPQHAGAHP